MRRPRLDAQFEGPCPYLHWMVDMPGRGRRRCPPLEIGPNLFAALIALQGARDVGAKARLTVAILREDLM